MDDQDRDARIRAALTRGECRPGCAGGSVGVVALVVRGDHQRIAATGEPGGAGHSSRASGQQHGSRPRRSRHRDDRTRWSGLSARRGGCRAGASCRRGTCSCRTRRPRAAGGCQRCQRWLPRERQREQWRSVTVRAVRCVRQQPPPTRRAV